MTVLADGSLVCASEDPPLTCDPINGYCSITTGSLECLCNAGFALNADDNTCGGMITNSCCNPRKQLTAQSYIMSR